MIHLKHMAIENNYNDLMHAVEYLCDPITYKDYYRTSLKVDGSASVVLGNRGGVFVSDKHRFSKGVVCFTRDEILNVFGHLPNLASSLMDLLTIVPKIVPKGMVFQGDLLFTPSEPAKKFHSGQVFTPNIHKYVVENTTARFGIAIHTAYGQAPTNTPSMINPDAILKSEEVFVPNIEHEHESVSRVQILRRNIADNVIDLRDHEKHFVLTPVLRKNMLMYTNDCIRKKTAVSGNDFMTWTNLQMDEHIKKLTMNHAIRNASNRAFSIDADMRKNREYINRHIELYINLAALTEAVVPENHHGVMYGPLEGLVLYKYNNNWNPVVKLVKRKAQYSLLTRTEIC